MRSFSLFPGSLKSWFKKRKRTSGLHGLNKTYICMFCHLLHFSIMSMWDVFCTLLLFFKIYLFIYLLFLAALDLRFCARAFSSCGKRGPLFIAVRGPLTVAVSLVAEHRLQTRRLSSCGSRVQLLRGMWDLPRPGLEPVSPAWADRFSTTAPPGKPICTLFLMAKVINKIHQCCQKSIKKQKSPLSITSSLSPASGDESFYVYDVVSPTPFFVGMIVQI